MAYSGCYRTPARLGFQVDAAAVLVSAVYGQFPSISSDQSPGLNGVIDPCWCVSIPLVIFGTELESIWACSVTVEVL